MKHALGVGSFCRKMYTMTPTGLPCDSVKLSAKDVVPSDNNDGAYYQMRPGKRERGCSFGGRRK
jgi:hypothetical protein